MTQPPSTEGPHPDGASTYRGRRLTRDVAVIGSIVVVGAAWWFTPETVDLTVYGLAVLGFMTVALAVIFGASMSAVRGFAASALLAAVVVTVLPHALDTPEPDYGGYRAFAIVLLTVGTLIVVSLAWFSGVVVGWTWRWAGRKWSA